MIKRRSDIYLTMGKETKEIKHFFFRVYLVDIVLFQIGTLKIVMAL